eukprot:TRINITY_DN487_c0_g2_i1.p1 TRINITY_DN487_c0_g2~~TRINITY_DN487_c0_g2_i1.p1  ORF type:complete len:697 (+),score=125.32 TRINITY_DN487_c0_g2_i1:242-2332(+)
MSSTEDWLRGQGRPSAFKLIDRDEDGRWFLQSDGVAKVREVTGPLSVVGIIGDSRKGKSYLMSRVAGHQDIFPLGHTYHACTHGVWAAILQPAGGDGMTVLALDFEGLDALEGTHAADSALWMFALLVTSVLVYNIQTVVDRNTLQRLAVMARLASKSKLMLDASTAITAETCAAHLFPTLVFCIRDAHLEPRPGEVADSAAQLMVMIDDLARRPARRTARGGASSVENAEAVMILHRWFTRDLVSISHPGDALPRIESKAYETLPQAFRSAMDKAVARIRRWASESPKTMWDAAAGCAVACDGLGWVQYVTAVVDVVNNDSSFVIETVVQSVSRRACASATAVAWQTYDRHMRSATEAQILPTEGLAKAHAAAFGVAVAAFHRAAATAAMSCRTEAQVEMVRELVRFRKGDDSAICSEATATTAADWALVLGNGSLDPECRLGVWTRRNEEASRRAAEWHMNEVIVGPLARNAASGKYASITAFHQAVARAAEEFRQGAHGPATEAVLARFYEEREPHLRRQVADLLALSAAERAAAEAEAAAACASAKRKASVAEVESSERMLSQLRGNLDLHVREVQAKYERERRAAVVAFDSRMERQVSQALEFTLEAEKAKQRLQREMAAQQRKAAIARARMEADAERQKREQAKHDEEVRIKQAAVEAAAQESAQQRLHAEDMERRLRAAQQRESWCAVM